MKPRAGNYICGQMKPLTPEVLAELEDFRKWLTETQQPRPEFHAWRKALHAAEEPK